MDFVGLDRPPAARRVELAETGLDDFDRLDRALLADDAVRRGEEAELHALLLGGVDLLGNRRHVLALAAVDDGGL